MPRKPEPPSEDPRVQTILYTVQGTSTGVYQEVDFRDGSIEYFGTTVQQTYNHVLIDNVGTGQVRVAFRPSLDLSTSTIGAKTLDVGGSLFIQDQIGYILIYFLQPSTVEIVGISD